jgi:reverse gyrase
VIQVIQDYVKHKGLRVELEINQERYNVLDWDPGELMEKVRDAQRRGSLVRGYHY